METNNSLGPYPTGLSNAGVTAPYGQIFYQNGNVSNMRPVTAKKRPTTASRRNNLGQIKKSFVSKNPSTLDLEVSRMRPRIIN